MSERRLLYITGPFYWPPRGADDIERIEGMRQLTRLGFHVQVITRGFAFNEPHVEAARQGLGLDIDLVRLALDRSGAPATRARQYASRLARPWLLDGHTWEYATRGFLDVIERRVSEWQPHVAFCDNTYSWPAAAIARRHGARVVIRSLQLEPSFVLQEHRRTPMARLRAAIRWPTEFRAGRVADSLLAITPNEVRAYRRLGARQADVLPLRSLPAVLRPPRPASAKATLDAFFMGSTYNVEHMAAALRFLVQEVAPAVERAAPGSWRFHVLGGKAPAAIVDHLPSSVTYHGYVPDLEAFLDEMDVALMPSLFGAGMQQKVFEPLCRGFPTVTHPHALAGYPFEGGRHLLLAETVADFVGHLARLHEPAERERLSHACSSKAASLFSSDALDAIVKRAIGTP